MLQNQNLRLKLRYHLNQCHQMSGVTKRRRLGYISLSYVHQTPKVTFICSSPGSDIAYPEWSHVLNLAYYLILHDSDRLPSSSAQVKNK